MKQRYLQRVLELHLHVGQFLPEGKEPTHDSDLMAIVEEFLESDEEVVRDFFEAIEAAVGGQCVVSAELKGMSTIRPDVTVTLP